MLLNLYQHNAKKFAKYEAPEYPFMGLSEEAGEVLGKIAKYIRKNGVTSGEAINNPTDDLVDQIKLELGDVLWMVSQCAEELGLSLEDVAESNINKLSGRLERGTICGEGDER